MEIDGEEGNGRMGCEGDAGMVRPVCGIGLTVGTGGERDYEGFVDKTVEGIAMGWG